MYYNSSSTNGSYNYKTTARYHCDVGFVLDGGDRVRTCDGDDSSSSGTWTGIPPTCSGIIS